MWIEIVRRADHILRVRVATQTRVDTVRVVIEIIEGHEAKVGDITVRRVLPRAARRSIGAWCFADHMGPVVVDTSHGIDVGPHPHMGLQTVTWLRSGAVRHRDSLGSDQVIVPGQLNLMTAGHGVSHSEERTGSYSGELEGIQLWIAQPDHTRNGPASFDHLAELPKIELDASIATVLVGSFSGERSPAEVATPLVGLDIALRGRTVLPLDATFEHGLIVLAGAVRVADRVLVPGRLAHLPLGADELGLEPVDASEPAQVMVLGGVPFDETLTMWWNFVGRSRDELADANRSWTDDDGRFGRVDSGLDRIVVEYPSAAPATI